MPGGSKKGGGLEVKSAYKMKGSPFQRNFGIGESETPDAESPLNFDLGTAISNIGQTIGKNVAASGGWGQVATKSLAAGMRTLKGGYDAFEKDKNVDDPGADANSAMEEINEYLNELSEEERKIKFKENPVLEDVFKLNPYLKSLEEEE